MQQIVALIAAVLFLGMGITALVRPEFVTSLFAMPTLNADMKNEVRAVYGGFGIAMAMVLAFGSAWEILRPGIQITAGAALVGMALGRVFSLAVDKAIGRNPFIFLILEFVMGSLLLYVGAA